MPDTLYVAQYDYLHSPFSYSCGIHTHLSRICWNCL